jgi:hypothetical protein
LTYSCPSLIIVNEHKEDEDGQGKAVVHVCGHA